MNVDNQYIKILEQQYKEKFLERKITLLSGESGLGQKETLEKFVYMLKKKEIICIDLNYIPWEMPLSSIWKSLEMYIDVSSLYMENAEKDSMRYMEFLFSVIIDFCQKGNEILFYTSNIMISDSILQKFIENIFEYILPEFNAMFICCNYIDKQNNNEIISVFAQNCYYINDIPFYRWKIPELEGLFYAYFEEKISINPELLYPIVTAALGNPYKLKEIINYLLDKKIIVKKSETYICNPFDPEILYKKMEKYIIYRYQKLDDELKKIVRGSSVLGIEFQSNLLQHPLNFKNADLCLQEIEKASNIIYHKIDLSYAFYNKETHLFIKKKIDTEEYIMWCTSLAQYYYTKAEQYLLKRNCVSSCNFFLNSAYYYQEASQHEKALWIFHKTICILISFMQYEQALRVIDKVKKYNNIHNIIRSNVIKENIIILRAACLFSTFRFAEATTEYETYMRIANIDRMEYQKIKSQYAICLYNTGQIELPLAILTKLYNEISSQKVTKDNAELVVNILSNLSSIEETLRISDCAYHFNLALTYAHDFSLTNVYYSLLRKSFIVHSGINYMQMLETAKTFYEKRGAKKDYAMTIHNLASFYLLNGDINDVEGNCNKAIKIFKEIGSDGIHYTYNCFGIYYCMQGNYYKGLEYLRLAYKKRYELFSKIVVLLNQITIHIKLGNFMCANQILKYIISLWKQDEADTFKIIKPYYYIIQADLYEKLNKIENAYTSYLNYFESEDELYSYRVIFAANKLYQLCRMNNLSFPTKLKKYLESRNAIAIRLLNADVLPVHLMFAE